MKYRLIIDRDKDEEIVATVHAPSALTQRIENLVNEFTGEEYILGYNDEEMRRLAFKEIECITVIQRKIIAVDTCGKHYVLKERLRDLERILPTYFIRINKSALANEHCIKRFKATFNGGVDAIFACGYREYVSRRCFSEIKRRYEEI